MCVGCHVIRIISPEGGQGVPGGAGLGDELQVAGQLAGGHLHVRAAVTPAHASCAGS